MWHPICNLVNLDFQEKNKHIEEINRKLNNEGYENISDLVTDRKKLQKIKNDLLSVEDYLEKRELLVCMKDLIAEDKE